MIDTSVQRVKISQVIENQLPEFVQAESPLFVDFMKQYYKSQEYQGGTVDIAENLDRYTKLQTFVGVALTEYTGLSTDTTYYDDTIYVDTTKGYPKSYGLLKIDDEIITYTGIGTTSFTGCIRGFSGVDNLEKPLRSDLLSFKSTVGAAHTGGTKVHNLSNLFIREFFNRTKSTFASGFDKRTLDSRVEQVNFIRQVKDFYKTKGTEESYKILFRVLYGEEVNVIKPSEFLLRPSDADYGFTEDFLCKSITGDARALKGATLFQDKDSKDKNILGASGAISDVKDFVYGGDHYYQVSVSQHSLDGEFIIPGRTRLTNAVSVGATVLTVDTTVGFPTSGSLRLTKGGEVGIVTYTGKTINQFVGLDTMQNAYDVTDDVGYNNVAYGYSYGNATKKIEVQITGVLNGFEIPPSFYMNKGDKIRVGTLGINKSGDRHFNCWIDNTAVRHTPKKVTRISTNTFNVETTSQHDFLEEDYIEVLDGDSQWVGTGKVTSVTGGNIFIIEIGGVDVKQFNFVRRRVNRGNSTVHDNVTKYVTDVQNTYDHESTNPNALPPHPHVYVASASIPSLGQEPIAASDRSVTWEGATGGTIIQVTTGAADHGFYSGEIVKVTILSGLLGQIRDDKNYYLKRVSSNDIQLANSLPDLLDSNFLSADGGGKFKISVPDLADKKIEHQKLLKRISLTPVWDGNEYETIPATTTGILINGTEVENYKSGDVIYYGGVEKIDVLEGGSDYNVINPPTVQLTASSGTGVEATANVKGELERIDVIDPGFDYIDPPVIEISGGNGQGAVAGTRLRQIDHFIDFDASSTGARVNFGNNTIGFTTFHKFRDGEAVIYQTFNNGAIGIGSTAGATAPQLNPDRRLVDQEVYYVAKFDNKAIQLANTEEEALSKSNLLKFTGYADGTQRLKSLYKKKVLGEVIIENPGTGYENKRRLIPATIAGINTYSDFLEYKDHGFKSGEVVRYSNDDGVKIGGLDTDQEYQVIRLNRDRFRLTSAGIGTTFSDLNYLTKQYVGFTSIGSGIHVINYPPIIVTCKGTVGLNTVHPENYHAVINPIIRGSITSINLEKPGFGYGSQSIFNFAIPPSVQVSSGSSSEYKAIVTQDGKIQDVIITRSGEGYTATPDLIVRGTGIGAKLISKIENGRVSQVTVANGGVGYSTASVVVDEEVPGTGAVFLTKVESWNVNNVKRHEDIFLSDDGFLTRGDNDNGMKFTAMYVPRGLRKVIKQKRSDASLDYAENDLSLVNNAEVNSNQHSPIIGWGYDGIPIYGPYGYDRPDGGGTRIMRSGYALKTERTNGPLLAEYPLGFFIEDYEYLGNGDLDKNNGRFCVTPDYPRGTYAYFATINPTENETGGTWKNYRSPVFPYLIGEKFAAKPDEYNFTETNNQDQDLNKLNLTRNTHPYKLDDAGTLYQGVYDSRKEVIQESTVDFATTGRIDRYQIVNEGTGYRVDENLRIENSGDGTGFLAAVGVVGGESVVSVASTIVKIENVIFDYNNLTGQVTGLSSQPHGLSVGDVVTASGLSTDSLSSLDGRHTIGFNTSFLLLTTGIGTTGATGIVTSIPVSGNFNPDYIAPDDIIGINTERMKILNLDPVNNKIRVQREFDGVLGTAHTGTTLITALNRTVQFNIGIGTDVLTHVNIPQYFDPTESLALGNTAGVGIGSTITYTYKVSGGLSTDRFIPTQTMYLPDHGYKTGQKLEYANGDGTSIQVYNGISTFTLANESPVFAINEGKDLLGISTNALGISSTGGIAGIGSTAYQLYFVGYGSGVKHSLKSQKTEVTGYIEKVVGTIVCKEKHNLMQGDNIEVKVTPGITTSYDVEYDVVSKRTIINPVYFGASEVNLLKNTINIKDHGYKTGQKVVYTSSNPINELLSHDTYFIYRVDKDNFRLSSTYYKSTTLVPSIIEFTTKGSGHKLSPINPRLTAIRGYKVGFAVSDTSLCEQISGRRRHVFDLDFYKDKNFTNPYFTNEEDTGFQVVGVGTVGVSTDAKVDLSLTQHSPSELWYKLTEVNLDISADSKRDGIIDDDIIGYSSVEIKDSPYNGKFIVTGIGSTTFSFNMSEQPEKDKYTTEEAVDLEYQTTSTTAQGPVKRLLMKSRGRGYTTIPIVTSIGSTAGVGAIVKLNSSNVGALKAYTTKNIGFDYSSDRTIRPQVQFPQILRLDRLSRIDNIGISSGGKNYLQPPTVRVIDRVTGQIKEEVITRAILKGTSVDKVELLTNTYNLYDTSPQVVAINNSNGVKIKNLSYTSGTNLVTLTLPGTWTETTYPFKLGEELYVENIGIGSTGTGYNSADYGYKPFVITGVNTNPGGGNASVSYNLDSSVTNPGIFSGPGSSGRAIHYKDIAQFNITVKTNEFAEGETVSTGDKTALVVSWNDSNKYLKVLSLDNFVIGDTVSGQSSKSVAHVEQVNNFTSTFDIAANSTVRTGWKKDTGKLNTELQRLEDNNYYQTFSYSLGSVIDHPTWRDPINSLGHVVGFKNFADVNVVSFAGEDDKGRRTASMSVGDSVTTVVVDLISENESLFNTYDFDLVSENAIRIDSKTTASDEVHFENKILTDYIKSNTNRALSIDSVSSQFNDLPRATAYSDIASFNLDDVRACKFYILLFDQRYSGEKEIIQVNLLQDGSQGYIMPFGRVETQIDLGTFDFNVTGSVGTLRFLPAKYKINNYALRVYSQESFIETDATGIGSTTLGTGYRISSSSAGVGSTGVSPFQVVGLGTAGGTTTTKLFVQTNETTGDRRNQVNELVVMQHGSEIYMLDYAQMQDENTSITNSPNVGLGTFGADVRSGIASVYFTPVAGVGVTMRIHQTSIDSNATGIGSTNISLTQILTTTTNIAATSSPQPTRISGFGSNSYQASDCLIEINDTTNNKRAVTQVTMIHDGTTPSYSEFGYFDNDGSVGSGSGIGTVGVGYSSVSGGDLELRLTPPANTAITTKVYQLNMTETGGGVGFVTFSDSRIKVEDGSYTGTENDIKFSFDLKHAESSVFHKVFDSSDPSVVDVTNNTFVVDNHFFNTGERLTYTPTGTGTTMSVGIAATTVVGFGNTNKLPSTVYAVKIAENKFKVSGTATEALQAIPSVLDINAVGVGSTHAFTSQDLNSKLMVTLDNNIQSPVIQSPVNTTLAFDVSTITDFITLSGISTFYSGDVIKVNNEFMKIDTVGIGSTNQVLVKRAQLNSALATHSANDTVTKYLGNYQIVKDSINFTNAPKGAKGPVGLTTTSTFAARAFLRSGVPQGTIDTYSNNFVFDTFANQFTGLSTSFVVKSQGQDITGFATNTGVVLINEIFQNPALDYNVVETAGITSISFTGAGVSVGYDVNVSSIPRGGVIVSVAETTSFGYQNLVSAGGTAIVSAAGTVESVSIGNSGSGYRVGLQTNIIVNAIGSSGIVTIGTANVTAGIVTSVTITNGGGSGFSSASPPSLQFDPPLNYENIKLTGSATGVGASISVVVGAGSSIIDWTITNYGYNYRVTDVLTLETGGQAGIPTDSSAGASFAAFNLTVDEVFNDSFSGWTFGELERMNSFEDLFDGVRTVFPLTRTIGAAETPITLRAEKGSPIKVEDNTIIFLNDVLQIPFESYQLVGGSQITFSEPPKLGDKVRIYFYRGAEHDITEVDILETIKAGDNLTLNKFPEAGLYDEHQQEPRTVTGITTADAVDTNTYIGPGISTSRSVKRPVTWKKQTSDVVIDEIQVGKDRPELEAGVRPTAYIITNVSSASTEFFTDSASPLFDQTDDIVETKQKVLIVDRTVRTGAAATAVVSAAGTISSVVISDGGSGFTAVPHVSIGVTAGIGTVFAGIGTTALTNATAIATISGVGTVSSVSVVTAGAGYTNTSPPSVLIESEAQKDETISSIKYGGDFGIITGIGTTTVVGIATTGITFDFYIPKGSVFRDTSVVATASTVSGIQTGYYFVINNSNVGNGLTAYADATGITTVGIGTSFIDNIYKVQSVETVLAPALGIGQTALRRVTVSVSSNQGISIGSSSYFGNYSWGRVYDFVKQGTSSFNANINDGITGIITGPVIIRSRDLKESY